MTTNLIYYNDSIRTVFNPPAAMGMPREDQLVGTILDNLSELAGRVCYDSLGSGRSSEQFHKHIYEVKHLSIYEHCNLTIKVEDYAFNHIDLRFLLNRPGIIVTPHLGNLFITFNWRVIFDWEKHNNGFPVSFDIYNKMLSAYVFSTKYPLFKTLKRVQHEIVPEEIRDKHTWATFYIKCSRGCSHELVRHGDFTAISQRSTRYCDESLSEWIPHPLIKDTEIFDNTRKVCQNAYTYYYNNLISSGVTHKQARGAARGLLGNALSTELIFSANMSQWKHMIAMRYTDAADGEIYNLFAEIKEKLGL